MILTIGTTALLKNVCGESAGVDEQAAGAWKDEFVKIMKETPTKNIFNADKAGLFHKPTADKTTTFKGGSCSGGKLSKEQLLQWVNMDSSEKTSIAYDW